MAFLIMAPTFTIILLDLALWVFRAGEVGSKELIRRSKSEIQFQLEKRASRSRSNSESSDKAPFSPLAGMTPSKLTAERDNAIDDFTEHVRLATKGRSAAADARSSATDGAHEMRRRDVQQASNPNGSVVSKPGHPEDDLLLANDLAKVLS